MPTPDLYPVEGGPLDGDRRPARWHGIARTVPRQSLSVEALTSVELGRDGLPVLALTGIVEHRYERCYEAEPRAPDGARLVGFRYVGPVKP